MSTNISIWMVLTSKGEYHFFVADDLVAARRAAVKLAGTRYRAITRIPHSHRLHNQAKILLGL